ncbi:MAG: hypothetical protein LUC36_03040 [Oscillospiraceae bacterium]|nr:hypothetical protein [Oscillospiraceae bacterium]
MADENSSRNAARAAKAAKAAYNIGRAAMEAGAYGAAAAAVKESLPFLAKMFIATAVTLIFIPMLVFTALPSMFFGYQSSDTDSVAEMTQKALTVGSSYMSLEDFENTYVDSIVTGIVSDYENEGIEIDNIKVVNNFDEDDLLWFIAINSVANRQNLDTMTVESIREFCTSRLSYTPALSVSEGTPIVKTLTVTINKLDAEAMMRELEFDKESSNWAAALYDTLEQSDALNAYAEYFEPEQTDYSGDSSYAGDAEHGTEYDNEIDISAFVSPATKNNLDLAAYAIQAWRNNWGYVWGTYGGVLTESLFEYKLRQYPDGVGKYEDYIRANWLGRRTTDCVGLIKGYGWLDTDSLTINYATNGMPDYSADQMYLSAVNAGKLGEDYGSIDSIPEIAGLAVWKEGHIGVYIGGGYVVEAMGTKYGVVKTALADRSWQAWCKIPYISYMEE